MLGNADVTVPFTCETQVIIGCQRVVDGCGQSLGVRVCTVRAAVRRNAGRLAKIDGVNQVLRRDAAAERNYMQRVSSDAHAKHGCGSCGVIGNSP